MKRIISVVLSLALGASLSLATGPAACADNSQGLLSTLKPEHPRLIIPENLAPFFQLVNTDEQAALCNMALISKARAYLKEPPIAYTSQDMLYQFRTIDKRVQTLAFVYRITKESQYLERCRAELLSLASFPDYHPERFLETAEALQALSLGYDWLYKDLSVTDRATIREALVKKGIATASEVYRRNKNFWIEDNHTNWNQVCHGSILMACLAAGRDTNNQEEFDLITETAEKAFASFQGGLSNYSPDGGWDEGPMYWHLATSYAVRTIASLTSALGDDKGLANVQGFNTTGEYIEAMIGPTGKTFNYADADSNVDNYPELFWLSKRFNRPMMSWMERDQLAKDRSNTSTFDMLWYSNDGSYDDVYKLPPARLFAGKAQVVTIRGGWNDFHAGFVGFKGGNNSSHHAHLDLGSFVWDADGVRWVEMPDPDNYNLPGYFDTRSGANSPRWQYYRLNTLGQNTLVIDGKSQDPQAFAPICESQLNTDKPFNYAIADLSQAYKFLGVTSQRRGIVMFRNQTRLLVQDEWTSAKPLAAQWQIHTRASVEIEPGGREATLRRGDAQLSMNILEPKDAVFTSEEVNIPAPQTAAPGVRKLLVKTKPGLKQTISVLISPYYEPESRKRHFPAVVPMNKWQTSMESICRKADTQVPRY